MNMNWFKPIIRYTKRNLPKILITAGAIGVVGGTVVACCATTKLKPIIDEGKKKKEEIRDTIPEDQQKKAIRKTDIQTGVKVVRLYAPSALIMGLSLTGMIGSNRILQKRNIALAATVTTLDASIKEYRARMAEKFGEDAEFDVMVGGHEKEFEYTDENGEKQTKKIWIADPNLASPYAFYFDEKSLSYNKIDCDMNRTTLDIVQNTMNDRLSVLDPSEPGDPDGAFISLNDLYYNLDMPRTKMGQHVGWRKHLDENGDWDNHIDLRIQKVNRLDKYGEWEDIYVCDPNVEVLFPEDN